VSEPDGSGPAWSGGGEGAGPEGFSDQAGERYEQRGLLGVGGMGRVYAAQDRRLRREVALKVATTPELTARLAREARITAQLEHPGIVAVYDAGHDERGRPWYTMRLIRGRTLEERLAECDDLGARLRLLGHFQDACQAVAYAHSMGIVHRDLKPANIMVGEFGETQVADWGLARPVHEALQAWDRIVTAGDGTGVAGTSRYMSPEQARGEAPGRAADVWCLGVVLHELLSGQKAPAEPGVAPELEGLDERVPVELVAIVRHCVARDPASRYPSAAELAADLGRYLDGRRVQVHDYTPWQLLGRLAHAWRAPLLVAAVALLGLAWVGLVGAQRTAEEHAVAQRNLAQALAQQALVALDGEQHVEAAVLAAHSLTLEPSPVARGVLAATAGPRPERVSQLPLPTACREDAFLSPDGTTLLCSADAQLSLWSLATGQFLWTQPVHLGRFPIWHGDAIVVPSAAADVRWLALADGRELERRPVESLPTLLSAGSAGVWSLNGTKATVLRAGEPAGDSFEICASMRSGLAAHQGQLLVGCQDGSFRVYATDGVETTRVQVERDQVDWGHLAFDGVAVFAGTRDGRVRRLELATGVWTAEIHQRDGGVLQVAPVTGTPWVLVRGERGSTRLWDTDLDAWVGALPARVKQVFAGSTQDRLMLLGDGLERWRLPSGLRPAAVSVGPGVSQVTLSRDGAQTAYALGDGTVGLLRTVDRRVLADWQWQTGVAKCVAFLDDGRLFAAAMNAGGGRVLAPGQDPVVPAGLPLARFRRAGTFRDGSLWALGYGPTSAWVSGDGEVLREAWADVELFDGSSSPDRSHAAFLGTAGGVWVHDGAGLVQVADAPDAVAVDVGDDGRVVVAGRREVCREGRCHDLGERIMDLALAPGGQRVAVGLLSGGIVLLDLATGEQEAILRGHGKRVSSLEWGPRGELLVSGSWDGTLRYWDVTTLDADPHAVAQSLETAWGLDLEAALGG